MESWIEQLEPIVEEYRGGTKEGVEPNEPLTIDEVEDLITIIRAKINLNEGNISFEEYEKILG